MSLSPFCAKADDDDKVATGIAVEARQLHDHSDSERTSTYIPAFVTEYLDDHATILRMLRACQGDCSAAAAGLARSLAWREENKVYP
ncbi:hypothetical protein GGI21_005539, partial [Coemansia aciculifera]